MNNSISNPEVQVPTGINLNDKDYIIKYITVLESENELLRVENERKQKIIDVFINTEIANKKLK